MWFDIVFLKGAGSDAAGVRAAVRLSAVAFEEALSRIAGVYALLSMLVR